MYGKPFVPPEFVVPDRLEGAGYHLRMLSVDDVEKDFEAVAASAARLKGLFGPDNSWPASVTLREDLVDLGWHEREFTLRRSFAYTVMAAGEAACLGCVYIFPSGRHAFDAAVFYWVRESKEADQFDRELGALVRGWINGAWPFTRVAYPGRDTPWDQWLGARE